jgi:zinc transport system permease protein
MYLSQNKKIQGDVAIGIFSTGSLAIGVLISSLSFGFNVDVYNYMFGSVLAVDYSDLVMSIFLFIIVFSLFFIFYNRLFLVVSDEDFAKSIGINVVFYHFLISFLAALTIVIGMRMMGTLLISSLIIFPVVIARKCSNSFKTLTILSVIVSFVCFLLGMIASFLLNIPIGASVVIINILTLLLVSIFKNI